MTTKDKFELVSDGLAIVREQLQALTESIDILSGAIRQTAEVWEDLDKRDKLRNDRRSQQRR